MDRFEAPVSYRQYLKQLTPSVLTMVFLSFYTTIDGFFVSRYAGSDALAAIIKRLQKRCSQRKPRFYRGFRHLYGEISVNDSVDIKKVFSLCWMS